MRLAFSHHSDPGLIRSTNQDAYAVETLDPRGIAALLVVADGMGGYEGGEVAARLAVDIVRSRVLASAADWAEKGILADGLVQAVDAANRAILQAQREQPGLGSMGSTLTAALIWGDRIIIGHVGDSKACLAGQDSIRTLTSAHNVAGELLQSGHLTAAQAAVHPQRHVLTRALGVGETVMVERQEVTWETHDSLVLCTDGLSNLVLLTEIAAELDGEFPSVSRRLVEMANARGGHDNITVLAARWEE